MRGLKAPEARLLYLLEMLTNINLANVDEDTLKNQTFLFSVNRPSGSLNLRSIHSSL